MTPAPTRTVPPPPRYVPGILPRTGARIPPRPGTQPPTTPPKLPQVLQAEIVGRGLSGCAKVSPGASIDPAL